MIAINCFVLIIHICLIIKEEYETAKDLIRSISKYLRKRKTRKEKKGNSRTFGKIERKGRREEEKKGRMESKYE